MEEFGHGAVGDGIGALFWHAWPFIPVALKWLKAMPAFWPAPEKLKVPPP